ncbi:hypothetical protein HGA64_00730 [Candidatus Falkowbacteria bacterium]|nr:hypothetical protein [Candidatus Falkowbacteria bacterium]
MMKKIVTFALFLFASFLTGIFIAGFLVSKQQSTISQNASGIQAGSIAATDLQAVAASVASTTSAVPVKEIVLSASLVAKHNTQKDCWMIVSGKIYDVSSYMNQHPAGAEVIVPSCGKDGTDAFSTKGGQGSNHSSFAWKLLGNYYVGDLNQKISVTSKTTSAVASSASNGKAGTPTKSSPTTATPPKVVKAPPVASAPVNQVSLTAAEAAKHNSASNCWLIVSGKAYDVTGYLSKHPAGSGAITPYCGADATATFSGTNGGHAHSGFAWGLLAKFYVGTLGQQATTQTINNNATQAQSAAQQVQGEEWEDD